MGGKPTRQETKPVNAGAKAGDTNGQRPRFCLGSLHPDYSVGALSTEQRAALATALWERSSMTWQQIMLANKHGHGTEKISENAIRAGVPEPFAGSTFLAMRYQGNLPMVGVREGRVFQILWIERAYGDLYDHD
jgi:hypothetical protein